MPGDQPYVEARALSRGIALLLELNQLGHVRASVTRVHRAMIGRKRTLFTSAVGRAFLAGASEAPRATVIAIAKGVGPQALEPASPALIFRSMPTIVPMTGPSTG